MIYFWFLRKTHVLELFYLKSLLFNQCLTISEINKLYCIHFINLILLKFFIKCISAAKYKSIVNWLLGILWIFLQIAEPFYFNHYSSFIIICINSFWERMIDSQFLNCFTLEKIDNQPNKKAFYYEVSCFN